MNIISQASLSRFSVKSFAAVRRKWFTYQFIAKTS